MVVIDEAHHITGIGENPLIWASLFASYRPRPGLLLLTATPEQAGLRSHFDRLQLIDLRASPISINSKPSMPNLLNGAA